MPDQPSTKTILVSASFKGSPVNNSIVVFSVPPDANILDITTAFTKYTEAALKSETPILAAISLGARQLEK